MKNIHMTPELKAKILAEFTEALDTNRNNNSGFTFKYNPEATKLDQKIVVNFSSTAWLKTITLVHSSDLEVAWQGVVEPNEERTVFNIKDILVYPQTVNATNVRTDEVKYEQWHQTLDDDTYNNLRFQGHSHVNMGVFPSSQDNTLYNNMLQTLSENSYYIFMIINKASVCWMNIYDLKNNCIYETADIIMQVDGADFKSWYPTNAKKYIYTTPDTTTYERHYPKYDRYAHTFRDTENYAPASYPTTVEPGCASNKKAKNKKVK